MGGDVKSFCELNNTALEKFKTFKHKQKFYPKWGEKRSQYIAKECNKTDKKTVKEPSENKEEEQVSYNIKVKVPNVRSNKGTIGFILYDKQGFMSKELQRINVSIKERQSSAVFKNVKPGTYAIVCLHDENKNGQMDFSVNGMPLEDYGSTNNVHVMGPPEFHLSKFELKNKDVSFEIKF